jgi:DNA repair protein RecO (recombination protein O)|tara:strand:- start:5371 stop:6051 length:681 start_codon:yes stop_codon:yes gene_type:complete
MNWIDEGFLIHKNIYNENSVIAEFYTKNHGKCSGIIFGGTSKKVKNYLQIGNKFHINFNFKKEGTTGYFKVEILNANSPFFFDNKNKLMCISSAMSLIKLLTVESEENSKIFNLIEIFFQNLRDDQWLKNYILWELSLFRFLGYDLNLKNLVSMEIINDQKKYFVKSNSSTKNVPNFLVETNESDVDFENLLLGLKLVTDYLDKSILLPNNISHPYQRLNFINIIK